MQIRLSKISSREDPNAPAYVAYDLKQVHKICELLGTQDTVWSKNQLDPLMAMALKGELNLFDSGHTIVITLPDPMKASKLTLGRFFDLTAGLPATTPMTFHGYDKGCGIHCYTESDLWLFPVKDAVKTHVVLNPGPTYDGRASDREDSSERETCGLFMVCEVIGNSPSISVHLTQEEAMGRAVRCALENFYGEGVLESQQDYETAVAGIREELATRGCMVEEDCGIYLVEPSN